jgi:hypothetical protein
VSREYRVPAALLGVLLVTYSPVLFATYGYGDDYLLFDSVRNDWRVILSVELVNGRPGMLALHAPAFALTPSMAAMVWMRVVSIAGIAAVGITLAKWAPWGRRESTALALTVVLLPAFWVTAAWSLMFVVPLALLAAMWAARQVDKPVRSLLLLTAAGLIYQPAAAGYLLPLAFVWADRRPTLDELAAHGKILIAASLITVGAWIAGQSFAGQSAFGRVVPNPTSSAAEFAETAIPHALLAVSSPVGAAIGWLVLAWILRDRWWLLPLVPAAYLPCLMGNTGTEAQRTLMVVGPLLVLLVWIAVRQSPFAAALVAYPAILAIGGFVVTSTYIAKPQQVEWEAIQRIAATRGPVAVEPASWTGIAPGPPVGEFGYTATEYIWAIPPMVRSARNGKRVVWIQPGEPTPSGYSRFRMDDLLKPR